MNDLNKLKVFGFLRANARYKIYDPTKYRYLISKKFGYLEAPKISHNRELKFLAESYQQRLEYQKYMNPKGLRYSVTSNFPKIGETHNLPDFKFFLTRTDKMYDDNCVKLEIEQSLSKPEIKQIFEKLYNIPTKKVRTAILPGEVKPTLVNRNRKFIRTDEKKRALIEFDFPVDQELIKLDTSNKKPVKKANNKTKK
jgi:ribosomal protein L23